MLLKFEDFILEEIMNESMNESLITEKFDINKMLKSIVNIKNKKEYINKLIQKFNSTTSRFVKRNIAILLVLLYFSNAIISNNVASHVFKPKIENISDQLSKKDNIDIDDLKDFGYYFRLQQEREREARFPAVDIRTVRTSEDGIDLIKDHERLVLTAYDIGDGMITIGYGHANPADESPYKVGDTITEKEAYRLFKKDLRRKEEGVRRMLLRWEEQGIDVRITQSMFDAMVSMAFNMGIGGLNRSEFVQFIKNRDYETAADLIKSTRLNPRFPGLELRRSDESELFLKDYLA